MTAAERAAERTIGLCFTRKDYEFMQKLIDEGEYTDVAEIVRDAVKRFRAERNGAAATLPFVSMGTDMTPMVQRMMNNMCCNGFDEE